MRVRPAPRRSRAAAASAGAGERPRIPSVGASGAWYRRARTERSSRALVKSGLSDESASMRMRLRRLTAPALALALGVALSASLAAADDPATGLKGEYFASADLTGAPSVTQLDGTVDFDWGLAEPFSGAG